MIRTLIAVTLAGALGAQAPVYLPKQTVKLVLNGPGLRDNVEVTDRAAIAAADRSRLGWDRGGTLARRLRPGGQRDGAQNRGGQGHALHGNKANRVMG